MRKKIGIVLCKTDFCFAAADGEGTRKVRDVAPKQKETRCFLRKSANSKRTHNRMCLWILNLARIKAVVEKMLEGSL